MATRKLAAFSAGLRPSAVPAAVSTRVQEILLDSIGNIVRARHDPVSESTAPLLSAVDALELGAGGSSRLVGDGTRCYPAPVAALINGTLAHSLDFDDTHGAGSIHCSAPVVPAALAAAEVAGSTGEELVTAITAGFEVMTRLSLSLDPTAHYERGYHPTATCGVFGAAAACGNLYGLDEKQMESAFGIALSQSSGTLQFLVDGSWTKRFQVGYASHSGVIAATLAREGFVGPIESVEGKCGILSTMSPCADVPKASAGLGTQWETMEVAVKPYPSCRYSHAAMDGIAELRAAAGVPAGEEWGGVQSVQIGLPAAGMILVAEPLEKRQNPETLVDGQFSMPFLASAMLRQGSFGWADFERFLGDPGILETCKIVTPVQDDRVEPPATNNFAATVQVVTEDGALHETIVRTTNSPLQQLAVSCASFRKCASVADSQGALLPAGAGAVRRAVRLPERGGADGQVRRPGLAVLRRRGGGGEGHGDGVLRGGEKLGRRRDDRGFLGHRRAVTLWRMHSKTTQSYPEVF